MARSGQEAKPTWRTVPPDVRALVAEALGGEVQRAVRAWGGYGPTPAYRLLLRDGRRAFFKGTWAQSNDVARTALWREERVYREIPHMLGRWAPHLLAALHLGDWHILLLDDLGPASVPPWTPAGVDALMRDLAAFHHSTLDGDFPDWLDRPNETLVRENWVKVAQDSQNFAALAALAGPDAEVAQRWFAGITARMAEAMSDTALRSGPHALLHGDLRSDNLRLVGERVILFDWPSASVGRPEWDVVAFAQTVTVEGGPTPEDVLRPYAEVLPLRAEAVDQAIAWWLSFFADRAWRPDIPGLPRLRRFQRQQLATLVAWAAQRWDLPQPDWAGRLLA